MLTPLAKLYKMTAKQLHNTLMDEYPNNVELREEIKKGVREQKHATHAARVKAAMHIRIWAPLIYQAYKAINTPKARVRAAQASYDATKEFDDSRKLALDTYTAYAALIQKVTDKLRAYRDMGTHTPLQLAREKGLPNDGEHWTDWIPKQIKDQFLASMARLEDDTPLELFPRKLYVPAKKQPYVHRAKKRKERSLSLVEQLKRDLLEADKAVLRKPTPANLERRDTLILQKEEAVKAKRKEYAKKYREQKKKPEGESQ